MIQANNPQSIMAALHEFGPAPGAKAMMEWETLHAKEAITSGIYITFTCLSTKSECFRVGSKSLCFCGHLFEEHIKPKKGLSKYPCGNCGCKTYKFMFQRPEEQGLWWLPRRKGFDIKKWKATCQCKHNHEAHSPNSLRCKSKCTCFSFQSDFPCIVCDKKWEEHDLLIETRSERVAQKKAVDDQYLPLAKNPDIQQELAKKMAGLGLGEDQKDELEEQKTGPKTTFSVNITPDVPLGVHGRGIEVQVEVHHRGDIRPKHDRGRGRGRAEKSVQLMEMKSGPQGGYSESNKPKKTIPKKK